MDPGLLGVIAVHLNRLEEWAELRELEATLHAAARAALDTIAQPADGELSITFVTDDEMEALNRRYRSRESTTDVIAFEFGEADELLGDVYISPSAARRAAAEEGIEPATELLRLVIHGTLHTLGHDHPEGANRWESPMYELQESLLRRVSGYDPLSSGDADE